MANISIKLNKDGNLAYACVRGIIGELVYTYATSYPKQEVLKSPRFISELFVLFINLLVVTTPQNKIIEQLEANIRLLRDSVTRLELEIFELKGDNKILKAQLKEATLQLQKQQGYYDDDGNYVE